jgi:hypothetical protein
MQWEYPWVLWSLAAVPGLIYGAVILWHQKRDFWDAWCRLPFMRQQSVGPSRLRYILAVTCLLLGFTLSVLGFASPVVQRIAWEAVWENVFLAILVDFSKSMEAPRDPLAVNAPSRFEEMRIGLLECLQTLPPGVKISLVPFSEYAIPITIGFSDDHSELIAKARRFQRDFFYKQGTDLTMALQEGFHLVDIFTPTHRKHARPSASPLGPVTSLVLISDGDEPVTQALRQVLAKRGASVPVFAIGVGSEGPAYIPEPLSPVGYVIDSQGLPVTTTLNATTLQFIAEKTGGAYYPFKRRGQLFVALQQIIQKQGVRSRRASPYPYPLRHFFFLGAFLILLPAWKFEGF